MRISTMTRRQLLQSTAAGATLAPFVPTLAARAAAVKPPLRLLLMYTSNGTVREQWLPKQTNGELELSTILKPLEKHKSRMVVVDGIWTKGGERAKGGHEGGVTCALTGSIPKYVGPAIRATNMSVDQHIAAKASAGLKIGSIEAGIMCDTYEAEVCALSYAGPMAPLFPQNDPLKIYSRVFGGAKLPGGTADPASERKRLGRQSVIEFVRADLNALKMKLGKDEQQKMERHLTVVREIEQGLATGAGAAATASCRPPLSPAAIALNNDAIPKIGDLQRDLMVAAMTCDLTRVGTLMWGRGGANHRFTWLGSEFDISGGVSGIHHCAHGETDPKLRALLTRMHAWYAGRVAAVVDKLKEIPEGDGTMADNTLVVWFNEISTGNHSLRNVPWVLVGDAQKQIKTGRLLSVPGTSNNAMLVSLCRLMGLSNTTSFGAPELNNGPLPGLV